MGGWARPWEPAALELAALELAALELAALELAAEYDLEAAWRLAERTEVIR